MKKIIYILFTFHILLLTLNAQWVQQNSGVSTSLYMIQFVNRYTGWATGSNSTIIKTTNGGENWFQQPCNLSASKNLNGLCMLDVNNGYIVGAHETILKTVNGGLNWIIIRDGPVAQGNTYNAVWFINSSTGLTCGFVGVVLRTTNGGLNWDSLNVGSNAILNDIQFFNSQTGWVCGDVGYLRKTTNGGNTWFYQAFLTTSNFGYNQMHFINVNTGWLVSEQQNEVFRTTNSGAKWDTIAVLTGGSLLYSYCIHFSSVMTGWIGGTFNRMFHSTNGGINWYQQTLAGNGYVGDINFFNDTIGWATGGGGRILFTTNGGGFVGIITLGGKLPEKFYLHPNYPNPFNPVTKIKFELPESEFVSLKVFDIVGREIATLIDESLKAGVFEVEFNGSNLSSGIYICRILAEDYLQYRKMILLK